ncbi:MAG TPA: hypothetical protein VIO16_12835 [Dehalococcoidia bacterium]
MPAAARKAKAPTRLELCRELLEIERANAEIFTRIDAIKTELKIKALADGKFRETFAGLGYVSVSPARPEEMTGEAPVIVVSAWSTLKPARQEKLLEDGLVKIEPIIKGAYHGRVDVKLHAPPT